MKQVLIAVLKNYYFYIFQRKLHLVWAKPISNSHSPNIFLL